MKKGKRVASLLVALMVIGSAGSVSYAEAPPEIVTKEYEFEAESEENLSYDAPESITENGKEYLLTDITYEIIPKEPITIEKDIVSKDKKYDKEIKEVIDGKEYTLTAKEPKWEEKKKDIEKVTLEEYRDYELNEAIPSSITVDDKEYLFQDYDTRLREDSFTAPAYFATSDTNSKLYIFNGKLVEISGDTPVWQGWESDARAYLGIDNTYFINGISWNGGFTGSEGNYQRTATISGTKAVSYQVARFLYDSEEEARRNGDLYEYTSKITYTAEDDGIVIADAIATYTLKKSSIPTIAKIGGGIGIVALAGAGLFFFMGKKKKEDNN